MLSLLLLLLFFLLSPALILYVTSKSRLADRLGAVLIAYGLGLLIGNIGILPQSGSFLTNYLIGNQSATLPDIEALFNEGLITNTDLQAFKIRQLQDLLLMLTIPLAIPLLLFSLRIRSWFRMAGKTFASLILGMISVILVVFILGLFFRNHIPEMPKVAGMLVGLYTGGTPNLAALKMMLNVVAETYLSVHTYDMIPSLLYLLFLISFGKVIFRKFLLRYPGKMNNLDNDIGFESGNAYSEILSKHIILKLLVAFGLSVLIFALAGLTTLFVNSEYQMMVVILVITTLAIIVSLIPVVHNIKKTFETGMYLILVFSVVVASMADVRSLVHLSGELITVITIAIFGSLLLHTLLSKLFHIDADTVMISSTAMICSPPFVPMVADALKNKEIILSGLTVGIIGYAAGNYLGVAMAFLFSMLF